MADKEATDADEVVAGVAGPAALLRAAWATLKPDRRYFCFVVSELNALTLVGEEGDFTREGHTGDPSGLFQAPQEQLPLQIGIEGRTVRERVEILERGGRVELVGPHGTGGGEDWDGTVDDMGRKRSLYESVLRASHEVLCLRAEYFCDITGQGVEAARQMAFLV